MINIPSLLYKTQNSILVVDISHCRLKMVYLKDENQEYKLLDYHVHFSESIEKYSDQELIHIIQQFLNRNIIKDIDVILSFSGMEGVVIKEMVLPMLSGEEMPSAIKWELAQEVPFNVDLAQVDWKHLGEERDEKGIKSNRIIAIIMNTKDR